MRLNRESQCTEAATFHGTWYRDDRGELSFVFKDCELSSLLAESLHFLYILIGVTRERIDFCSFASLATIFHM